jgi:hypothetical protein
MLRVRRYLPAGTRTWVSSSPAQHSVAMDVTWEGHIAWEGHMAEPRQYLRSKGRVVFDTQRLAQTGCWSGTLSVGGTDLSVTPDRCWGTRDRSWGVRPVGEPEGDGIRQGELVLGGMWNYFPMQFDDHAIMYICHERDDGERPLVQSERVWVDPDRPRSRTSARSEHSHHLVPGTRVIDRSVIRFPDADLEITCTPLLANYVSVGTGYGIDADWRHGMYHGPDRSRRAWCSTWRRPRGWPSTASWTTWPASPTATRSATGCSSTASSARTTATA